MRKSLLPTCWPARTQDRTSGHCARSGRTQHSGLARDPWGDKHMQVTLTEHSVLVLKPIQRALFSIFLQTFPWRLKSAWRNRARCLQPMAHTKQLGSSPALFPARCSTLVGEHHLSGSQPSHLQKEINGTSFQRLLRHEST